MHDSWSGAANVPGPHAVHEPKIDQVGPNGTLRDDPAESLTCTLLE
jgi:hypothetical protein